MELRLLSYLWKVKKEEILIIYIALDVMDFWPLTQILVIRKLRKPFSLQTYYGTFRNQDIIKDIKWDT